jgi:hypothetical protein
MGQFPPSPRVSHEDHLRGDETLYGELVNIGRMELFLKDFTMEKCGFRTLDWKNISTKTV